MNILIVGGGGREHALAWKIKQSPLCGNLYVCPGNAGMEGLAELWAISAMDFAQIAERCVDAKIDLLVVGPDDPLAAGIVDFLRGDARLEALKIVGPKQIGAQLESSKSYAKQFMIKHGIPTATYREFTNETMAEGIEYLRSHTLPIVLKADGLALGKGVLICESHDDAIQELQEMLAGKFGAASEKVVVEQFLKGIEMSSFIITDGKDYVKLPSAKDYKRIGVGDTGLNTGGMGAISPVPFEDEILSEKIKNKIIAPTVKGLEADQIYYRGFIFFGLIIVEGEPYVIEYNARMGDPETEVVMPRVVSDLVPVLMACAEGAMSTAQIDISPEAASAVILVSEGYPGDYEKGRVMQLVEDREDSFYFHMGTKKDADGQIRSNGGRLLACVGRAEELKAALTKSFAMAEETKYAGKYYRHDIGNDVMKYIE